MLFRMRGAVLIMSMMAIGLVFMMLFALINTSKIGLNGTASFYEREAALQAAQSGMDYAVTRIQKNRFWRGDGNCAYYSESDSDKTSLTVGSLDKNLMVVESYGNVVGLLRDKAGNNSGFRIKFNFENTADDVLSKISRNIFFTNNSSSHASPSISIAMPYVSLNNLSNDKAELLYRAPNSGKGLADTTENLEVCDEGSENRAFAQHVPPQRVHIIVEGLAGRGLRDCTTPQQVNDCANAEVNSSLSMASIGPLSKRYVEASFSLNHAVFKGNAAYANRDIKLNVAQKAYVKSTGYQSVPGNDDDKSTVPVPGQLCSNTGDIFINCGSVQGQGILNTFNGKLYISKNKRAEFKRDDAPYVFHNSQGNDETYYFQDNAIEENTKGVEVIDWDKVAHAKNNDSTKMKAGFYRWEIAEGGTDEAPYYELRYYPDGFVGELGTVPKPKKPDVYRRVVTDPKVAESDASTILMGPAGKVLFEMEDGHITKPTLILKGKLYCDDDLLICSNTDKVVKHIPAVFLGAYNSSSSSGSSSDNESAVLTGKTNITLLTPVKGEGAVVTNGGDVNLVGESVLDSGDGGVAVYGNNVTVNSLELAIKKTPDNKDLFEPSAVVTGKPKDYALTNAICGKLYPHYDDLGLVRDLAVDYFKTTHNVKIKIESCEYRYDKHYLAIYFKHVSKEDSPLYEVRVYSGKIQMGKVTGYDHCGNEIVDFDIHAYTAPGDAVIGLQAGGEDGQSVLDNCAKMFDSVCYGDTVINGIVYAKKNFLVNLGDRYKLVIKGAVRAEQENIDVACSYAYLTYDEQCLDKLMPNYCTLTMLLWNCW